MKNNIFKICFIMFALMMQACSEYEVVNIPPNTGVAPDEPDDRVLFPNPEKNIDLSDGPVDLGDPLIPDIEVSFIQHDFGIRELTDPPVDANLEIRNVGDYPLRISSITQTAISNSFVLAPLANTEIQPGDMENLIISYLATQHGPDADVIRIKSNDPDEASVVILVAGNGATPVLEIDPPSVDFGNVDILAPPPPVTLQLTNTGTGLLEISKIEEAESNPDINISSYPTLKLSPGDQTTLDVSYLPTDSGSDKEKLNFISNDPAFPVHSVIVEGATADPDIDAPTLVDFGLLDVGVTVKKSIAIDNVGTGILNVSGVYFTNSSAAFSIAKNFSGDIAPGASEKIKVEYTPDDVAPDSNSIEILSSDPDEPSFIVSLIGEAGIPEIDVNPNSIDFGVLDVGDTLAKTIKISNVGTGTLHVSTVYFTNSTATFSIIQSFAGVIPPASSADIEIEYQPDDYIPDSNSLHILSDDPQMPTYVVSIAGEAGIPEIEVDPLNIDYGSVYVYGNPTVEKVRIANVGTGKLLINSLSLQKGVLFSWNPLANNVVDPGFSVDLEVVYTPVTYAPDTDELSIDSNDPNNPLSLVSLEGWGSAPQLEIYPDPYDFGTEYLECDKERPIDLKNVGDADLEITNVEYFTSFPNHFSIDYDFGTNGQFPWTIAGGSWNSVYLEYLPMDVTVDSSFIKVHSDDPQIPIAISYQYGQGAYYSSVMDTFTQSTVMMSDILFIIDNSCSMGGWQTHVATNFDSFITVFQNSGVDFHIATITTDQSTFVGNIIDTNTVDPIAEFNTQAQVGTYGSGWEMGLDMAYDALQPGGEAAPGSIFERPDAKMSLIFVSDEPDSSQQFSNKLDYSAYFKTVKLSSSRIIAHAVGGDCPSGCYIPTTNQYGYVYNSWASCGNGYDDVVTDMGGTYLSMCDTDWGLKMETLAKDSIVKSSFELSDTPVQSTIEVVVGGVLTGNWTFDPLINSVVFDPSYVPPAGSIIDISYNILGGC